MSCALIAREKQEDPAGTSCTHQTMDLLGNPTRLATQIQNPRSQYPTRCKRGHPKRS